MLCSMLTIASQNIPLSEIGPHAYDKECNTDLMPMERNKRSAMDDVELLCVIARHLER